MNVSVEDATNMYELRRTMREADAVIAELEIRMEHELQLELKLELNQTAAVEAEAEAEAEASKGKERGRDGDEAASKKKNAEPKRARRKRKRKEKEKKVQETPPFQVVKVYTREIDGILFFVDADYNVYDTHEVVAQNTDPTIIATCKELDPPQASLAIDQILRPDHF